MKQKQINQRDKWNNRNKVWRKEEGKLKKNNRKVRGNWKFLFSALQWGFASKSLFS